MTRKKRLLSVLLNYFHQHLQKCLIEKMCPLNSLPTCYLTAWLIACEQTSPLPQEKIGRRDVCTQGGETSVHRQLLDKLINSPPRGGAVSLVD